LQGINAFNVFQMKKSDLKFLVVGAGAIGEITAAMLKKAGIDVEIVCKYDI